MKCKDRRLIISLAIVSMLAHLLSHEKSETTSSPEDYSAILFLSFLTAIELRYRGPTSDFVGGYLLLVIDLATRWRF